MPWCFSICCLIHALSIQMRTLRLREVKWCPNITQQWWEDGFFLICTPTRHVLWWLGDWHPKRQKFSVSFKSRFLIGLALFHSLLHCVGAQDLRHCGTEQASMFSLTFRVASPLHRAHLNIVAAPGEFDVTRRMLILFSPITPVDSTQGQST